MFNQHAPIPGVRRIAVLRANAIGDFIFALPAFEALRAAYPRAEIVLLAKEWHAAFLRGRPGPIDRVVVVPPSTGVNARPDTVVEEDPALLERFFSEMRRERFDLALQMHGGGRHSNPFLLRLGARVTVGTRTPDAAPLDRSLPYVYYQSEILRLLEIAALAGAPPVMLEPRLALTAGDQREAEAALPESAAPLAILHPGVGDERRRWPAANFAAVGDALSAAGARIAITGTDEEQPLAAEVAAAMRATPIDLCGRLSLGALGALFTRSRVVVANDTGPLHIAEAVGAATVGIYWCGNLINADPITRARHRPVLSWRLTCPVCGLDCIRGRCEHRVSFVDEAPLDEAIEAALALYAQGA